MAFNPYAAAAAVIGGFPDDYLVFDFETNGIDATSPDTLILQIGYCVVDKRVPVDRGSLLLDWTQPDSGVDPGWLANSIERTRSAMAQKGKPYHVTIERMQNEGCHPIQALSDFVDLLTLTGVKGFRYVGHNAYMYDRRLMEAASSRYGVPFVFPKDSVLDTGMIEKAMGLRQGFDSRGSSDDWNEFVYRAYSKTKWSLDGACADRYDLYGRSKLAAADAHDAGVDCLLTHHLLEAMRDLSEDTSDVDGSLV